MQLILKILLLLRFFLATEILKAEFILLPEQTTWLHHPWSSHMHSLEPLILTLRLNQSVTTLKENQFSSKTSGHPVMMYKKL